jgi:hypothetical protein
LIDDKLKLSRLTGWTVWSFIGMKAKTKTRKNLDDDTLGDA